MGKTREQMITDLLIREGGYTNDPDDLGGPTNYGITLLAWHVYTGKQVTALDIKNIRADQARVFYDDEYVKRLAYLWNDSNTRLFELALDSAVNHGMSNLRKWVQKAVGAVPDGVIGPMTIAAVQALGPTILQSRILSQRIKFYGQIVVSRPSQLKYLNGWLNRALEFAV